LPDFGVLILQIAKHERSARTGFYAGWPKPLIQAFSTERTFLDDTLRTGGKILIRHSDERAGILPIEAARAIGTRDHTVSAADAAMPVHHHNTVFPPPSGLRRAYTRTGRIAAVITKNKNCAF